MREGESLDERLRKELLRSELKERNKGKKIIRCKYRPKYPDSAEREYVRLINAYMTIEKEVLMKYIPEIVECPSKNGVSFNIHPPGEENIW